MTMTPIQRLKDKYLPLFLGFLLLFSLAAHGQTYSPSVCCTVSNKSYGAAQAVSTDGRSWFYDASNFVMRDYNGPTEVFSYLNLPKYRSGHFPIYVHSGGILQGNGVWLGGISLVYWFKDSTGNANLVRWYTDSTGVSGGPFYAVANNLSEGNAGLIKGNLSLDLVNNTSDAQKNAASVSLTNHTINGSLNTLTNIPNSALTNNTIGLTLTATGSDVSIPVTPAALGSSITINIPSAAGSVRGVVTAADWTSFHGKIDSTSQSNDSVYDWRNGTAVFRYVQAGSGTGISSLNGLTTSAQLFATGTTGSDFNIVSAIATHTFNLPVANASNTGKLSNTDWSAFNAKEPSITPSNTIDQYWNGYKQFVALNTDSIQEGSNHLFFTNARARAAVSLTTTGTSGVSTYNSSTGVFNIPNYSGATVGNAFANNTTKGIATFDSSQFSDNGAGTIFLNTTQKGVIINETFANLNAFQEIGSGGHFAVSSNTLNITGGTSFTLANYIQDTLYGASNTENVVMEGDITVGTVSATSFGVGFGFQSQQAVMPYSVTIGIGLNSGTGTGLITYYFNNSTSGSQSSPTAFTFSAGNVLHVVITYSKNTFYTTVINTSLTAQPIVNEFSWTIESNTPVVPPWMMPNAFMYSIFALGGNHNVNNFKVTSNIKTRTKFLWCGDSIHKGYGNKNINDRTIDDIGNQINEGVAFNGSPAARIEDLRVKDILSYNSTNIILSIGTNNIGNSESATTVASKMQLLVDSLVAAGYTLGTNLYVTTLPPRNSNNVTAVNDSLIIRFPSAIIDLYQTFKSPSTIGINPLYSDDGLHLNTIGNVILSNVYLNFFKSAVSLKTTSAVQPRYARLATNGYLSLGAHNQNPSAFLDVVDQTFQSQQRVSITPNSTVGMWLSSIFDGYGLISGGMHLNTVPNLIADATEAWAIGGTSGIGTFYASTGLTIGGIVSPNASGGWQSTGMFANTFSTGSTKSTVYRTINSGGDQNANTLIDLGNSTSSAGAASVLFDGVADQPAIGFAIANGAHRINRGGLQMTSSSDVAGSENGILSFLTKPTSDTPFIRLQIKDNGNVLIGDTVNSPSALFKVTSITQGVLLPRMNTTQQNAISSPASGLIIYNTDSLGLVDYNGSAWLKERTALVAAPLIKYQHTIFTPTTGGTVNLVNGQYNIVNPAGALLALTVNLPSSPANNDAVYIKFTQTISTVTYANGTVVDGITAPTAGGLTILIYDSGTTSWY